MSVPTSRRPISSSAKRSKRWSRLFWWIPGILSFVVWLSLALRHLMLYESPWRTLKSLARATWYVIDHSTPGLAIGVVSAVLVVVLVGTGAIRRDQRHFALAVFVFFGSLLLLLALGAFLFAGSFA